MVLQAILTTIQVFSYTLDVVDQISIRYLLDMNQINHKWQVHLINYATKFEKIIDIQILSIQGDINFRAISM